MTLAGDGSYLCPYRLDTNDVLVRSVPAMLGLSSFIDEAWLNLVAELNVRLWVVQPGRNLPRTLGPALEFVRQHNAETPVAGV